MSDAELRDAALAELALGLAELRLTTRGLKGWTPTPGSHWALALSHRDKALALLGQIAAVIPPIPPGPLTGALLWDGAFGSDGSQWHGGIADEDSSVKGSISFAAGTAEFVLPPHPALGRIELDQGNTPPIRYGSRTLLTFSLMVPAEAQIADAFGHQNINLAQWHTFNYGYSGGVTVIDGELRVRFFGGTPQGEGFSSQREWNLGVLPRDRWLRFRADVCWHADPAVGHVQLWTQLDGGAWGERVPMTQTATAAPNTDLRLRSGIYHAFPYAGTLVLWADGFRLWEVAG